MTNEELTEIEKLAALALDGSLYGEHVPMLCAEIRALWAVRDATRAYSDAPLGRSSEPMGAMFEALDSYDQRNGGEG